MFNTLRKPPRDALTLLKEYSDFILDGKEISKKNVGLTLQILQSVINHKSHQNIGYDEPWLKGFNGHITRKAQRQILSKEMRSYLDLKRIEYIQLNKIGGKRMKIATLKDIKEALQDVPDELLDNIHFGLGEGAEEQVSMLAPEGSKEYEFPQVWDLVEKKYPKLNDLNHFIQNVARVQSNVDSGDEMFEKMYDEFSEREITSEDFPEDKPKSSPTQIKQEEKDAP